MNEQRLIDETRRRFYLAMLIGIVMVGGILTAVLAMWPWLILWLAPMLPAILLASVVGYLLRRRSIFILGTAAAVISRSLRFSLVSFKPQTTWWERQEHYLIVGMNQALIGTVFVLLVFGLVWSVVGVRTESEEEKEGEYQTPRNQGDSSNQQS
jgi:hypothetical protein